MTDDLLELAFLDPPRATATARELIGSSSDPSSDPAAVSVAHQALGIMLREEGRTEEALAELRTALRLAGRSDVDRLADVRATYGFTLAVAGRTRAGALELDRAVSTATGETLAKVLMRRAAMFSMQGRQGSALTDMRAALAGIRRSGNRPWQARTLNNMGHIQLALGKLSDAERSLDEAEQLFAAEGLSEEALHVLTNRGVIAFDRGDLPRALALYAKVALDLESLGRSRPGFVAVQSETYLAAGLTQEAVGVLEDLLARDRLAPSVHADMQLAMANARLANGEPVGALVAAREARTAFRRQQRGWFELRARLAATRARLMLGDTAGLARQAREIAERLDDERATEAPLALTLAGRLASDADRPALLGGAASYRKSPNALVRASAWLAEALGREHESARGGTLRACGRGLDALDEHRQTLGSSELRALATSHGRELATIALRHAAHDGRTLLRWSERWRATALAQAPVAPDGEVSAELAALRDNGRRLAAARTAGDPTEQLEQDRRRLERAVRASHHHVAGQSTGTSRLDVGHLVAEVGTQALVELVDVDGVLHVLVVSGGRVRRRIAGSTADASGLADKARFVLRRSARGRPYDPGDLGDRLQEALLGPAARLLPDGPVVVVPTGPLHGVPWGLLPALADRPFSVVPSAAQWLRARAVSRPADPRVVLLAGPGLGTGGAEVPLLATLHPDAALLDGAAATVEGALDVLDGADLAHVAAHGHFRADSPLFSSLELVDGPLTVHDLERLRVAPHRLILSACESGVLAPVGADELLGLASALFSMGTAGMVSSVAEVNDEATAALMVDLHDRLADGDDLAGALLAAREAARGDRTREATAAAFLALGV